MLLGIKEINGGEIANLRTRRSVTVTLVGVPGSHSITQLRTWPRTLNAACREFRGAMRLTIIASTRHASTSVWLEVSGQALELSELRSQFAQHLICVPRWTGVRGAA